MCDELATKSAVPWTRRGVLARLAFGCGSLFLGGWAWLVSRAARSGAHGGPRRAVTLPPGAIAGPRVLADVLVLGGADGTPLALDRRCPHLGCRVALAPDQTRWECPCHGSRFRLHGELERGPAPRGLTALRTRTDAQGRLVVTWP